MITSSQSANPLATMTLTGNTNTLSVTTSSGVSGVVLTKPINQSVGTQQTLVGNSPQIVPTNVQILNVNTIRANAPNQTGNKGIPQRVMITPQMVGARPGQPGVCGLFFLICHNFIYVPYFLCYTSLFHKCWRLIHIIFKIYKKKEQKLLTAMSHSLFHIHIGEIKNILYSLWYIIISYTKVVIANSHVYIKQHTSWYILLNTFGTTSVVY